MRRRKVPRGTFWIGGLTAVALGIPLHVLGIAALSQRLGWGPPQLELDRILIISSIFSGFPAFLAGGGVARLCAHRLAERPGAGVRHALARALPAMGLAGLGLALLCAVPLGLLPDDPRRWGPLGATGLAAGVITGLAIAILAGMRHRRHVARGAAS